MMEIEEIIEQYLSNSATEQEKKILLQWLEDKEENRAKFGKMYDLCLYSSALLIDDEELKIAQKRFNKRISNENKRITFFSSYLLRIAASILLLISAGYAGYQIRNNQTPAVAINRLLTGADGKGEYILPDGSKVWLNANSILEYPESFTGEKREVKLEGEALFEVKKDPTKPFFVKSGGIAVEVLGTRFLVINYPDKPVVETMLVSGSVKISNDFFLDFFRILEPGELITYNKQTTKTEISRVNTNDYTNWIHSKLVFDKTNLTNVIINLEKWYGVEIVASPELTKHMHMTFTIRRESLDDILKYMSVTSNITHKWNNNILYLSPKK